ncbi:MAG TPA: hypothetical protein DCL77_07185 [Prolixibacteraceae bacterium]|nr:hypothetical protein [Prolixibacteraceae bacterium]
MCESYNLQYGTNFISVMPTNLYGPNDNFDLEKSHVLPAMLRKMHLGKCLEENNWQAIREDLNKRPIEGISGESENVRSGEKENVRKGESENVRKEEHEQKVLAILKKYGISTSSTVSPSHLPNVSPSPTLTLSPSPSLTLSPSHLPEVSVELWGTGAPFREFLWSEEMADACVFLMENIDFQDVNPCNPSKSVQSNTCEVRNSHINIGTGKEITIRELAYLIKSSIGFNGQIVFNTSKPDGTMRKLTDPSKLHALGWHHQIEIEEGIQKLYRWYLNQ